MAEPAIRPMTVADLPAVVAMEQQLSPHPWNRREFEDSLNRHVCRVLADGQSCQGFLVFSRVLDQAELLNIGVASHCQGKGYGRMLVRYFIDQCKPHAATLFLEVRAGNESALGLYESEGFCEAGLRRDYYITPQGREDAIVMALDLAGYSNWEVGA